MKARLRFPAIFVVALLAVPNLPFYVERTLTRSMLKDGVGDLIEYGWALRSLTGFWADYRYFRPEQQPELWLAINITLAILYAGLITFILNRFIAAMLRRRA